jgi:uncharacterized protein YprB with RNaseH-like and TPR domain
MIISEKYLEAEPTYRFELLAPKERILFYDIETTGISMSKASMYLIGVVFYESGRWKLRQFFAETLFDEPKLLAGFFDILNERKRAGRVFLVSYNGDGFDLPFLKGCIRPYGMEYDFTGTFSLDLLKKVRPYRKVAGLSDCRLKMVEKLCGICREDRYSGGELIYVYEEYLRLSRLDPESCENTELNRKLKDELLRVLLLHNAEDILDMPLILDVLGYEHLFEGGFEITESTVENGVWDIHAKLETPLPKGIYRETPDYVLSVSEEDPLALNLAVTLYEGELKSFYTDYKNYYYLPAEDCAVHKSVGEFVDRKARRQATARTCYQRVSGSFVPQPEAVFPPMFYREYKQLPGYGRLPAEVVSGSRPVEKETAHRYVKAVLKDLLALREEKGR